MTLVERFPVVVDADQRRTSAGSDLSGRILLPDEDSKTRRRSFLESHRESRLRVDAFTIVFDALF